MSVSFADFQARFPELASVDEGFFNVAKNAAMLRVADEIWACKTDEACLLMTAHIVTISKRNGNAGPVTSSQVDKLRRSFGQVNGAGLLGTTSYGMEFEALKQTLTISPMISPMIC